jgi:hypothetical protein
MRIDHLMLMWLTAATAVPAAAAAADAARARIFPCARHWSVEWSAPWESVFRNWQAPRLASGRA